MLIFHLPFTIIVQTPKSFFFFQNKMACQLPIECLDEIFEYLEEDNLTLHSCLLVNRLWCKIVVRILWRNIFDFKSFYQEHSLRVASSILSTLIACLPNESKELLHKNEISIPTPTSNPPLFNYPEFCKVLPVNEITRIVYKVLKNRNGLVANEIIKMITNQSLSLKKFTCYYYYYYQQRDPFFPYVPEARDLLELCCSSNLSSYFFSQLSKICHNLQSISISFDNDVSNELKELKELISLQNNLKNLTLSACRKYSWASIIPAIIKHSQTITKLRLYGIDDNLPFSFVSLFTNLQEFIFSFVDGVDFKDFKELQYANFSKLEILKIPFECPKPEYVMKFLENNGKNLKYFYTDENNKVLNLSIVSFCPKIRSLFIKFSKDEIDTLKNIFISCKDLESIKIWYEQHYSALSKKELLDMLDIIVNYSPNNFHELKLYSYSCFNVSPEDLESFFMSWKNRTPKKLLNLIFIEIGINENNLKIIKKYENLGVIKFWIKWEKEEGKDEKMDFYY
jgi:hypothetical protein